MAKTQIVLLTACVLAACLLTSAEAQQRSRFGRLRQRNRYLARQELDETAGADGAPAVAVTPYPSADELKPEIPFEEAAAVPAAPTPDEVYGPPEQTYSSGVPDEIYGPPEFSDNGLPGADAAVEPFPPTFEGEQARLVVQRRANLRQRQLAAYRQAVAANGRAGRPAKLRAASPRRFV